MPIKGLEQVEIHEYYTLRTMPLNEKFYLHPYGIQFFSYYVVVKLDDFVYDERIDGFPLVEIVRTAEELVANSYTLIFHKNESQFYFVFTNDECLKKLEVFEEDYLWFPVEYSDQVTTTDSTHEVQEDTSIVETITDVLTRKQDELQRLVDNQDYLGAATLRDEIKLLEKELKNDSSP